MREVKINTMYRHFKGFIVYVIAVAKHTETNEELVIYSCYNEYAKTFDGVFARPKEMFLESIDSDKYPNTSEKYRFTEITTSK